MTNLPEKIIGLAKTINQQGGRAMLNGGCVRDELMGLEPKDWDIEVYGVDQSPFDRCVDVVHEDNDVVAAD